MSFFGGLPWLSCVCYWLSCLFYKKTLIVINKCVCVCVFHTFWKTLFHVLLWLCLFCSCCFVLRWLCLLFALLFCCFYLLLFFMVVVLFGDMLNGMFRWITIISMCILLMFMIVIKITNYDNKWFVLKDDEWAFSVELLDCHVFVSSECAVALS